MRRCRFLDPYGFRLRGMRTLPGPFLRLAALLIGGVCAADEPRPNADRIAKELAQAERTVVETTEAIVGNPKSENLHSRRADALFFLGRFPEALRDYDRLVELDPAVDASHWRRGICYFYVKDYDRAAKQFERYHSFDNVDRENGIWRYLSQVRAYGRERARQDLLKYEKDDREPFPAVYRLFAGETTPAAILQGIRDAKLSDEAREQRAFYADLYIGLNAAIEDDPAAALTHLRRAVDNRWAPVAGYGPHYMWHVARLQYDVLAPPHPDAK